MKQPALSVSSERVQMEGVHPLVNTTEVCLWVTWNTLTAQP